MMLSIGITKRRCTKARYRLDVLGLVALLMASVAASSQSQPQAKFRIGGAVVDAVTGAPLEDVEVSVAYSRAESMLHTVTTGADGHFEFKGLARGKYALTAQGRGYRSQGYEQHDNYFTGIVTGPGMQTENLTFRLKPDAAIAGTVSDEFNDPVQGAQVLLFMTGLAESPQTVVLRSSNLTDDAGRFHFAHLPEGKYYVVVSGHPWYAQNDTEESDAEADTEPAVVRHGRVRGSTEQSGAAQTPQIPRPRSDLDVAFQTQYYPNATDANQAVPIAVRPGDRVTTDFHFFAVPALRLKVRGSPAYRGNANTFTLSEQIFTYSRSVNSQDIDANDVTLSGLAPGHYLIQFPPLTSAGMAQLQPVELLSDTEIAPGQSGKLISSVSGTVQIGGTPLSCMNCYIRLVSVPSGESFGARVTDKGFEIAGGVRPGRYHVWLLNNENYLVKDIVATGARVVGKQLEIASGASVRLAITATKGVATIDGVALADGKPVSQTLVLLVPNDPAHNLVLFRRDQSDSDGTFTLRDVLPGDYTVIAVAEGWDIEWANPAVIKAYLSGGVAVHVQAQGKYQVKVPVQMKQNSAP